MKTVRGQRWPKQAVNGKATAEAKRVVRKRTAIETATETAAAMATATAIATWRSAANLLSTSFKMPASYTYSKEDRRSY